jgi:hypothetical protein
MTMKALTIKDLSVTEQLDSKAMAGVRGGNDWKMKMLAFPAVYQSYASSKTVSVEQANNQIQDNDTGNGSAVFGGSITAFNTQTGLNFNSVR